jgi:hypothetical protein
MTAGKGCPAHPNKAYFLAGDVQIVGNDVAKNWDNV